jgi:hypothetical protein
MTRKTQHALIHKAANHIEADSVERRTSNLREIIPAKAKRISLPGLSPCGWRREQEG